MGEWTVFSPGDSAPNDGTYIEIGVNAFHMGVNDPKKVRLAKGERFPETSNHERKWKRMGRNS
ncbi:YjzC family protein [Paenibacillus sp. NEAU-GSW1]|uniref:YjzC family protein n=1 Tax=Paenibacillus sp. NEAU-GSW1 TaxID=2682486 RepID=UPI0012E31D85|nr:YjzC family protein [Paenibacillus sp. NEAU-GSW1]MUT68400.1 YjzC family protein [Paenibacillus sp. NEAU-GSW1]